MDNNPSNKISLYGEVVGFYEKDRNHFIILFYNSRFFDIALKDVRDIYLGDKIIVHSDLTIEKIVTQVEQNNKIKDQLNF